MYRPHWTYVGTINQWVPENATRSSTVSVPLVLQSLHQSAVRPWGMEIPDGFPGCHGKMWDDHHIDDLFI